MLIGISSTGRNLDDQRVSVTRLDVLLCIEAIISVISILHDGRSCNIETTTYQPILVVTNLLSFITIIVFSSFVSVVVRCTSHSLRELELDLGYCKRAVTSEHNTPPPQSTPISTHDTRTHAEWIFGSFDCHGTYQMGSKALIFAVLAAFSLVAKR